MEKGYNRFLGFADIYDDGRPRLPRKAIEILKEYYKKDEIDLIVDIGCGTGLSTQICTEFSNNVIGIEPSEDMLTKAKEKENSKLTFIKGLGNDTGLESNSADIVICSQAFHWMEPETTITEVSRILKKGGIFAVIDTDNFPVIDLELEKLNKEIYKIAANSESEKNITLYSMKYHLDNIINSRKFDYCRQICFCNEVEYTKENFKKYILSKSNIQKAIKNNYRPVLEKVKNIEEISDRIFKEKALKLLFPYTMKIGIK